MYQPYLEHEICPKCAWPGIGTHHEPGIIGGHGLWVTPHPERMVRTCTRCLTIWHERPIGYTQQDEENWIAALMAQADATPTHPYGEPLIIPAMPRRRWWQRR